MRSKWWIAGFLAAAAVPLSIAAFSVARIDPFFHYHAPLAGEYFYGLNNQRSQNIGILRSFDYEGIITGTSLTENFRTSEADRIFGCTFVKVPFSGGSYREINDNLSLAAAHNEQLKIVIRGLDMKKLIEDKDAMRTDMGDYPTYLYNENPLDDVQYLFNRDVVLKTVYRMETAKREEGFEPGVESFDSYSNWMPYNTFGVDTVFPEGVPQTDRTVPQADLTEEERQMVLENVRQNVTELAGAYPDVTFCYYITPSSAAWWQGLINQGTFCRQIQAEQLEIEEILKVSNIKLYGFSDLTDITTDLDNYKDSTHYGDWINSRILRYIKDGKGLLTEENYLEYLQKEKDFYWSFDYELLKG